MVDVVAHGVVGTLRELREHIRLLTARRTNQAHAYGFVLYLRDLGVLRGTTEPGRYLLPDGALTFVHDVDLTGSLHEVAARLPREVCYLNRYRAAVFLRRVRREGPWYA